MSEQNINVEQQQSRQKYESAFRIYKKIFEFWQLSDIQAVSLLGLRVESWQKVKAEKTLPQSVLGRLSHILWIARLSTDLYPLDKELSVLWLNKNNFEQPFLGMSPLYFMLSVDATALEQTHCFLANKFARWGALRNDQNELVYLNDELRICDEPLDTLMCMAFRVIRSWQLSQQEERGLIGMELSLVRAHVDNVAIQTSTVEKIRTIVLIDLILWHLFHDHKKVTAWVKGKNTHPLFEEKPPLQLLCLGSVPAMKVVYAYLRNISP